MCSRSILPDELRKTLACGSLLSSKKPASCEAGAATGEQPAKTYDPLEQTESDELSWKLNQPCTEVLVGAPK